MELNWAAIKSSNNSYGNFIPSSLLRDPETSVRSTVTHFYVHFEPHKKALTWHALVEIIMLCL